jgi:hypothetical protein
MPAGRFVTGSVFIVVVVGLFAEPANAQLVRRGYGYRPYYHRYGYGYRYNPGSYANSMANLIRAQSQAEVNYQQARSQAIDNQKKWAANYFKMKEERQAYDARQHEKNKPSAATLEAVARSNHPAGLGSDVLDPVTGHITWPESLQNSEYSRHRIELDELFAQRAKTSQSEATAFKIHAVTIEMQDALRKNIENMPSGVYMSARKFLDSLDYAGHSHAG